MGKVVLPDTILRKLEREGRIPPGSTPAQRRATVEAQADSTDWPGDLAWQCRTTGLPDPEREWRGIPGRRFRFDLAFPDHRVAVEVDGGSWQVGEDGQQGGRHNRASGFAADCEKLSLAAAHGWRVVRCTPEQVRMGQALAWVTAALRWPN